MQALLERVGASAWAELEGDGSGRAVSDMLGAGAAGTQGLGFFSASFALSPEIVKLVLGSQWLPLN